MNDNGLKDFIDNLMQSKKQGKEVNTKEFKIKGNIIYYFWEQDKETALQISNISQIDIGPAPKEKIPGGIIIMLFIGIALILLQQILLGLVITAIFGGIIYLIIQANQKVGNNLIIQLNSGKYFLFNFRDKAFLSTVFNVLIDCINHKTSEEMIINISNSTIQSSIIGSNNQMEN